MFNNCKHKMGYINGLCFTCGCPLINIIKQEEKITKKQNLEVDKIGL